MRRTIIALVSAMALSGCANTDPTVSRTGTGAALGAVAGGALGSLSGNLGWGALIGAGAGAAGGYLYDYDQKTHGGQ